MTQDAELKNYQLQWTTEEGGGSVSWNTEQARSNDDDDFILVLFHAIFIKLS